LILHGEIFLLILERLWNLDATRKGRHHRGGPQPLEGRVFREGDPEPAKVSKRPDVSADNPSDGRPAVAKRNSATVTVSVFPLELPDFSALNRFPTTTELTSMVEKLVLCFGGFWDEERERQCRHAIEHDGIENIIKYLLSSAHYPEYVVSATLARMRGRLC
jgi:hypothetical protein